MTGIVLVTHDGLGELFHHQAELILGRSVQLTTVSVSHEADPDTARDDVTGALAMSADDQGVVVITDLPGATPHNLALRAAAELDIPVVSGLSLPMLLKVLNHASQPPARLARLAATGGRQGITGP